MGLKRKFRILLVKVYDSISRRRCFRRVIGPARYEGLIINEKFGVEPDTIRIAFRPTGGLGDYIISSALLDEIVSYGKCKVDVYCKNMAFGNAVYADRPSCTVVPEIGFVSILNKYDLVMTVEHFVHIHMFNPWKIAKISPDLAQKVVSIVDNWSTKYLEISQQPFREAMHFKRCEYLGINRWTELNMGGVFSIKEKRTKIYLHNENLQRIEELGLKDKKYITVNYGADKMGTTKTQIKVWPMKYFVEFVSLFREAYPNIDVVQLGGANSEKISGCNQYVLGENLETSKWLLKQSMLHIDCEGGLVHLATQLDTKCVVIFGPTPLHMYGYEQNINLISDKCCNCMGTHEKWAFECFKGMIEPECMYSITPEIVMQSIKDYVV